MHHSFYNLRDVSGNYLTSCGEAFRFSARGHVTGLDSLVRCGDCVPELQRYREQFPLASNAIERRVEGDRLVEYAIMEGGAR